MASNKKIGDRLLEILKGADLNVTTERSIRKQLEEEFSCSLADRKDFIRQEVGNFLRSRHDEANDGEEEEDEDEEGEEEPQEVTPKRKRKPRKSKEEKPEKKKRTGSGGLNKICLLSPQLADLLGVSEMPRTQVVKEIWNYIREHNLQDPENKRRIICNDTMHTLLGTACTDMFQMNKLLSRHIFSKPGPNGEVPQPREKKAKGEGVGGFKKEQPLSLDLQEFLGTGETHLARHEVVKRMWVYIKENGLQNPADKRNIICDQKLQKMFGVESFNGFGVVKLLKPHIGVQSEGVGRPDEDPEDDDGGEVEQAADLDEAEGEDHEDEEEEEEE